MKEESSLCLCLKVNAGQPGTTGTPVSESQVVASGGAGVTKKERELARAMKVLETSSEKATLKRNEYLLAVASENVALNRSLETDFAYVTLYVEWLFRKAMVRAFRFSLVGDAYSTSVQRCEEALRGGIEELDTTELPFPGCSSSVNLEWPNSGGITEKSERNVRDIVEQLWSVAGDHRVLLDLAPAAFVPRTVAFEPFRDDLERNLRADSESVGSTLMRSCSGCREASLQAHVRVEKLVDEMRRLKEEMLSKMAEPLEDAAATIEGEGNSGSLDSLYQIANPFVSQIISRNSQETFAIAQALIFKQREYFANERQFEIVRTKLNHIQPVLRHYGMSNSAARPSVTPSTAYLTRGDSRLRKEVFGVRLVDYVELNREPIPMVLRSCIRFLTEHAMYHPGVFRVSGSQPEILDLRTRYNNGEDPLDGSAPLPDVNSVASLLKLYLRELAEPLLPPNVAQKLVDLRASLQNDESRLRGEIRVTLKSGVPAVHYVVLRYLFAFLNHVTTHDENMMDAHNLAVCFGPTVTHPLGESDREAGAASISSLPILLSSSAAESSDLVSKQRSINEMIADLIVNNSDVFDDDNISGPLYSPSLSSATDEMDGNSSLPRQTPASIQPAYSEGNVAVIQVRPDTPGHYDVGKNGDSNSLGEANDEPAVAGRDGSESILTSESASARSQRDTDDATLSDCAKSAIAQKAGVFFRERASEIPSASKAGEEREEKASANVSPLHYSVSASEGAQAKLGARQFSPDSKPRKLYDNTGSNKSPSVPTVPSNTTMSSSKPSDSPKLTLSSARSSSPGREESLLCSPRTAKLLVSSGVASLGHVAGIREPPSGTTPLLKAVTSLNSADRAIEPSEDETDAGKRPPPVARKPLVGKK